jgi:hypothetical protein
MPIKFIAGLIMNLIMLCIFHFLCNQSWDMALIYSLFLVELIMIRISIDDLK